MAAGSLTVVGTGIRFAVHLTPEAQAAAENADELLYVATDPYSAAWLDTLNPNARSLNVLYRNGRRRAEIYEEMVETILEPVRGGKLVCAAFYGHPGVFVHASNEAIRLAREEGYEARMLPAVSAEDCLFADLGVDPARFGCHSHDATDFLLHRRQVDTSAALVVWQIGTIGEEGYVPRAKAENLDVLADYLLEHYPGDHEVTLYEASPYPIYEARIRTLPLDRLAAAEVSPAATLYVPPGSSRRVDEAMARRLGLPPS
jgi:uncharacterized protein YabN with tetrapyrrole methylase and pyrophosphatase domain